MKPSAQFPCRNCGVPAHRWRNYPKPQPNRTVGDAREGEREGIGKSDIAFQLGTRVLRDEDGSEAINGRAPAHNSVGNGALPGGADGEGDGSLEEYNSAPGGWGERLLLRWTGAFDMLGIWFRDLRRWPVPMRCD